MRYRNQKRYRWVIVFAGTIAMAVIYGTVVNSFGQFVQPICASFGYTNTEVSAIISFKSLGVIIGAALVMGVIRKYGAKECMVFCSVILALAAVGLSMCSRLWQFYGCAVIMGISVSGTTLIPISVIVNNWFEAGKRSFALSIAYMGSGLGGFLLNPVLNSIIQGMGWNAGFLTIGLLIIILYLPVIAFLVRTEPVKSFSKTEKHKTNGKPASSQTAVLHGGWEFHKAVKSRFFVMSAASCCIINMTGTAVLYYLVSYFLGIGFTESKAAWLAGMCTGLVAAGKVGIGWFSDNASVLKAAILGIGAQIICFISLSCIPSSTIFLITAVVCYGLGIGCLTVLPPAIINTLFGARDFTRIMGVMTMMTGIGTAVGPLLMGTMIDLTGSYRICFTILIVLSVIAGICIIRAFAQYKRYS